MLIDETIKIGYPRTADQIPESKQVYFDLLKEKISLAELDRARSYLTHQLRMVKDHQCDLPIEPQDILEWAKGNAEAVGQEYRTYLERRHAGEARNYFKCKSHALNFLKSVAPTKLVDGAWLYGMTAHWQDSRFSELIQTYLEELGEGIPDKNHVVIYRKLLASNGCEQGEELSNEHFVQGAIQLALAYHASDFLPEVIGFNLGYEQLPLHLLISAYELNELGIDPYYFTLHVTVDNVATGHAYKAVKALFDAMPKFVDASTFYKRVINGYKLNMLGTSTLSAIKEFDLEKEIVSVLAAKSSIGCLMHSDYCRIAGHTVNEWLSDPAQIPDFLDNLNKAGWIKRHQDPGNSRFWKLIEGEHAEMFGVFNAYERQVIHDWIAGEVLSNSSARALNFKARKRLLDTISHQSHGAGRENERIEIGKGHIRFHAQRSDHPNDVNLELRALEEKLAGLNSREELMANLVPLMSPACHHTAPGLMATRVFAHFLRGVNSHAA